MRRDDDNTIQPTGIQDFWERYDDANSNARLFLLRNLAPWAPLLATTDALITTALGQAPSTFRLAMEIAVGIFILIAVALRAHPTRLLPHGA